MNFVEWWKTNSAKAGEEYEKLRFDAAEINDFRSGLLNLSAKAKFKRRVKQFSKLSGGLLGGCLGLLLLLLTPLICLIGYSFYTSPPPKIFAFFTMLIPILVLISLIALAIKVSVLWRSTSADLKKSRVKCEQGHLTIKIWSQGDTFRKTYSVNDVEFRILEDAIGAEIHRQFLSPIVNSSDSRTTVESYRFYYLPQSKLILHYEQI